MTLSKATFLSPLRDRARASLHSTCKQHLACIQHTEKCEESKNRKGAWLRYPSPPWVGYTVVRRRREVEISNSPIALLLLHPPRSTGEEEEDEDDDNPIQWAHSEFVSRNPDRRLDILLKWKCNFLPSFIHSFELIPSL